MSSEDEIKIEDLLPLLDKCITSDKESVKRALRGLLVIVALSTPADAKKGPLEQMLEKVKKMEKRISTLEREVTDVNKNRSTGLTYDRLEMMRRIASSGKTDSKEIEWRKYTLGGDKYDPS